jgi:CRP/FNR family cyclic AMP-dependent transcriptional regulator
MYERRECLGPGCILEEVGPNVVAERESGTSMDERLELLQRVPLFAGVDRAGLEEIGRIADEIEAKAGADLTHEGRHEGYFFVIVSGSVRIDRGGQTINTMGPGEFLGEIALLDGGPRTATATTDGPTRLLKITHEDFRQLVDTSPGVRAAVLAAAGARLRAMDAESVI